MKKEESEVSSDDYPRDPNLADAFQRLRDSVPPPTPELIEKLRKIPNQYPIFTNATTTVKTPRPKKKSFHFFYGPGQISINLPLRKTLVGTIAMVLLATVFFVRQDPTRDTLPPGNLPEIPSITGTRRGAPSPNPDIQQSDSHEDYTHEDFVEADIRALVSEVIEKAKSHYRKKEYRDTINKATSAIELLQLIESHDPSIYYYRGLSYKAIGKKPEAIKDLQIAMDLGYEKAKKTLKEWNTKDKKIEQ